MTFRTTVRAVSLVEHARSLSMEARVVDRAEEALDEVSLIATATTSHDPLLSEEIPKSVFVAAVGAFTAEMAELPAGLVGSSVVVVDTLEGVREEVGI